MDLIGLFLRGKLSIGGVSSLLDRFKDDEIHSLGRLARGIPMLLENESKINQYEGM